MKRSERARRTLDRAKERKVATDANDLLGPVMNSVGGQIGTMAANILGGPSRSDFLSSITRPFFGAMMERMMEWTAAQPGRRIVMYADTDGAVGIWMEEEGKEPKEFSLVDVKKDLEGK